MTSLWRASPIAGQNENKVDETQPSEPKGSRLFAGDRQTWWTSQEDRCEIFACKK